MNDSLATSLDKGRFVNYPHHSDCIKRFSTSRYPK